MKHDYNSYELCEDLLSKLKLHSKGHNHFLYLLGDDFAYFNNLLYRRIENVMEYTKNHLCGGYKINMFYSTPSKYFESVFKSINKYNIKFENYYRDFFPYADKKFSYWTGYFTSRPYLKGKIIKAINLYYISSKIISDYIIKIYNDNNNSNNNIFNKYITYFDNYTYNLDNLLREYNIVLHHDAITGTCRQSVEFNYNYVLNNYTNNINLNLNELFNNEKIYNFNITKICMNNPIVDYGCFDELIVEKNSDSNWINLGIYNSGIKGNILINIYLNSTVNYLVYDKINGTLIKSDMYCIKDIKNYNYNKCILSFFLYFEKNIIIKKFSLKKNNNSVIYLKKLNEDLNIIKEEKKNLTFLYKKKQFILNILQQKQIKNYKFNIYHGIFYGQYKYMKKGLFFNKSQVTEGAYIFRPINKSPEKINIFILLIFFYLKNKIKNFYKFFI